MISLEFVLTSLVVVLVPGTGVIYTVSTALLRGRRAAIFASLGCAIDEQRSPIGRYADLRGCTNAERSAEVYGDCLRPPSMLA